MLKKVLFTAFFLPLALAALLLFFNISTPFSISHANAASAPTVTTGDVILMSSNSIRIYSVVNPNGDYTLSWYDLGTSSSFGSTAGYRSAGSGTSNVNLNAVKIGLLHNTTYYYRAVAQNSYGTNYGVTKSFTTLDRYSNAGSSSGASGSNSSTALQSPSLTTNGPGSVTSNSAVLYGSVKPNSPNADYWFEFGETSSLGSVTSTGFVSGDLWQLGEGTLTGLKSGVTYYYRVSAKNVYGTSLGDIKSFTTAGTRQTIGVTSSQGSSSSVSGAGNTSGNNAGLSSSGGGGATNNTNSSETVTSQTISQNPGGTSSSFVSIEYSFGNSESVVLVADTMKPKAGDDFSYTIVYKNDTGGTFYNATLKAILPIEVQYLDSNLEPLMITGSIVEFKLGDLNPNSQGAIVLITRVRDDLVLGSNLIFTTVLGYQDSSGSQLANTSFITLRPGVSSGVDLDYAAFIGSFFGGSILWLMIMALTILMALLIYRHLNGKKITEAERKQVAQQEFRPSMPHIFEPVDSARQNSVFYPVEHDNK